MVASPAVIVVGLDHLLALAEGTAFEAKMVLNVQGAVFGPVSVQHRDLWANGIGYADDYKGNAVAAMLRHGTIEVRFHKATSGSSVTGGRRTRAAR